MATNDDLAPENTNKQTFIVKDERAALRMKREETKEAQARYKAIIAKERAERAPSAHCVAKRSSSS